MDGFTFFSSDMDSMPNTVMEAMSFGLPVAATSVGGVPEMLSPTALVPVSDVDAMGALMRRIAGEAPFRSSLAEANRRTARTYTMDARCTELERIYQSVIK